MHRLPLRRMLPDDSTPANTAEKARVLLVEEDSAFRGAVSRLFSSDGFSVLQARDPDEALGLLRAGSSLSVIIIGARKPLQRLADFVLTVRATDDWLSIPVIVLSAVPLPSGLRTQGVLWLPKPVDPDRLLQLVAEHTGGR